MSDKLVVYHKRDKRILCLDGFASAMLYWKQAQQSGEEVTLIPAYYQADAKIPIDTFSGKDVVFVDFAYPVQYMDEIHKVAKSLLVIDHHKTSMFELGVRPYARITMEHSACVMVWKLFHPDEDIPKFLRHIESQDLGKSETLVPSYVASHLHHIEQDPQVWSDLFDRFNEDAVYSEVLYSGQIIAKADSDNCQRLVDLAFPIVLGGIEGLALNANEFYSHSVGAALARECGTFGAVFYIRPGNVVKFYLTSVSDDVDVEAIAVKYTDGGGHARASGFSVPFSSFISMVDLASKNVSLYLSLQTHLESFAKSMIGSLKNPKAPLKWTPDLVMKSLTTKLATYLNEKLGAVSNELEVSVAITPKIEYTSLKHRLKCLIATFLPLPFKQYSPKWYHRWLPYKIEQGMLFDDAQISSLLEFSKARLDKDAIEFVIQNLQQTVKKSYVATLCLNAFDVELTVRFPNSSFYVQHTFTI